MDVNLWPWYPMGSIQMGILVEAALRLTRVVLCNHKMSQLRRQSQTHGLSSKVRVSNLAVPSINSLGKVDNWLELKSL